MKEQLLKWLDEDGREYEVGEQEALNWLIKLKHGKSDYHWKRKFSQYA